MSDAAASAAADPESLKSLPDAFLPAKDLTLQHKTPPTRHATAAAFSDKTSASVTSASPCVSGNLFETLALLHEGSDDDDAEDSSLSVTDFGDLDPATLDTQKFSSNRLPHASVAMPASLGNHGDYGDAISAESDNSSSGIAAAESLANSALPDAFALSEYKVHEFLGHVLVSVSSSPAGKSLKLLSGAGDSGTCD